MLLKRPSLPLMILLLWAAVVIALTTLPSSIAIIHLMKQVALIDGHPNANDAFGHATLYGTLTALIYAAFQRWIGFARAFWIALIGAMLLGLTTELLQHFSPGRDVQLSDLLGNWLGIMTVAMLIGYRRSRAASVSGK